MLFNFLASDYVATDIISTERSLVQSKAVFLDKSVNGSTHNGSILFDVIGGDKRYYVNKTKYNLVTVAELLTNGKDNYDVGASSLKLYDMLSALTLQTGVFLKEVDFENTTCNWSGTTGRIELKAKRNSFNFTGSSFINVVRTNKFYSKGNDYVYNGDSATPRARAASVRIKRWFYESNYTDLYPVIKDLTVDDSIVLNLTLMAQMEAALNRTTGNFSRAAATTLSNVFDLNAYDIAYNGPTTGYVGSNTYFSNVLVLKFNKDIGLAVPIPTDDDCIMLHYEEVV